MWKPNGLCTVDFASTVSCELLWHGRAGQESTCIRIVECTVMKACVHSCEYELTKKKKKGENSKMAFKVKTAETLATISI